MGSSAALAAKANCFYTKSYLPQKSHIFDFVAFLKVFSKINFLNLGLCVQSKERVVGSSRA